MPELPDISAYIAALRPRVLGSQLRRVRIISPSLLRTFSPPIDAVAGSTVTGLHRLGKRIVLDLDPLPPTRGPLFLALHLMIAGRLRWLAPGGKAPGKLTAATLEFEHHGLPSGTLALTEAGTRKRAALHVLSGEAALAQLDPGGLEPLAADLPAFAAALRREHHTLKRALTDPRLLAGIGNAYSDEILHAAGLSPLALTHKLTDAEIARLYDATRQVLAHWVAVLEERFAARFPGPGDITAFRPEFAVHGKFGQSCPRCGTTVQRIRYADNETNYCPQCQTSGRVLADRSLSRLLRDDWPHTLDELEAD